MTVQTGASGRPDFRHDRDTPRVAVACSGELVAWRREDAGVFTNGARRLDRRGPPGTRSGDGCAVELLDDVTAGSAWVEDSAAVTPKVRTTVAFLATATA